jgi:hypothetical protein
MTQSTWIFKNKRAFSGTASYHKIDIARGQLETAIRLFLVEECDMFSAITLANAAGELLHRLVLRTGKKTLVDSIVKISEFHKPGETPAREAVLKHIHEVLFVNRLKHFNKDENEIVEFDAEQCALGAILVAIADYKTLTGKESESMTAILTWTYMNLNSADIMERWKNVPDKLKKSFQHNEETRPPPSRG